MYAVHDAGSTTAQALPAVQTELRQQTERIEKRAVEASERSALETREHADVLYDSTAAVLQLVEGSARSFAEMLEAMPEEAFDSGAGAPGESGETGRSLDVYA